jgi:hypothetical protein
VRFEGKSETLKAVLKRIKFVGGWGAFIIAKSRNPYGGSCLQTKGIADMACDTKLTIFVIKLTEIIFL